ncbi:MAG: peptidoglycan DD-metalloendopeptidase family protein [Chloroflexi bacterium]|nr:peptidoglycan DD-metalloendopeptidase family protein [Chloroflexota bacterium]
MKRWFWLVLGMAWFIGLWGSATAALTPPPPTPPVFGGGANDEEVPHDEFSAEQEQAMWAEIQHNLAWLRHAGLWPAADTVAVSYNFPLRMVSGLPDYDGFRVSAFADHNPTGGATDYNGGTRTYNGHRGTDYALYPFNWNKVDAGEMEVIAAADGLIVAKSDSNPADHNCNGSSGGDWNYVALTHADGRMTIYGHMRYNSLTSKGVGQTVAQGEYLGTVASSGFSSGPHLHFEVREGTDWAAPWRDPFAGPNSQAESLWANQRPYRDSAVNRIATHSAPPSTPDICQPSITHFQDDFSTPSTIYLYVYYRDYQGQLPTQLTIYRPDGSVYETWSYTDNEVFFYSAYRWWTLTLTAGEPAGTWRFEATYNDGGYETFFNVDVPTAVAVNSPNGGEAWPVQFAHPLTWADNLGGEVNIALYHNGAYHTTLATNIPSDGEYVWVPEATLPLGAGYTIRVTSVFNPALYDESDAPFSLLPEAILVGDDFALTAVNTPVTLNPLGNDAAPQGATLAITAVGHPISGTVSLFDSQLIYTPTLDFIGTDVFTYTVSTETQQAEAAVTIRVAAEIFRSFVPLIGR